MAKFSTKTTGKQDSKFASTVHNDIKKSTFKRDQIHKTTFNAGKLVPIYIDEVLPGDTHKIDLAYISRLATPIFPTMDNIDLDFYFFFVPNRLVWDGWQKLHGENETSPWSPSTYPSTLSSMFSSSGITKDELEGTLWDYYGYPLIEFDSGKTINVSPLPFRGYKAIWNRWFRDQNLQAPLTVGENSSVDVITDSIELLSVNKKHDYFTSCLPQPLKPIADNYTQRNIDIMQFFNDENLTDFKAGMFGDGLLNVGDNIINSESSNIVHVLRTATQLTKLLERDARGGTRYVEMLKAHFNVEAEDYRLQHPEFLGHHRTSMNLHQVAQTSSTDEVSPQGNLSAYGMTAGGGKGFVKSFVEHGYIHGFVVARQRKTYQQGIERTFFRRDRFDWYYPELAHITEQPVYDSEIFATSDNMFLSKRKVFGFQEAWADYRYKPNRVSGQFRSDATNSLDAWHYADYYENQPYLTSSFITDNSENNIARTLAVDSNLQNQFILDLKVMNRTTRPMPVYSIPGFMDHF